MRPRVAIFRPDDGRLEATADRIRAHDCEPVCDPMLAVEPTGATPPAADLVVVTSVTGARLLDEADWPADAPIAAIGPATADALRAHGYRVDVVPGTYSSAGLVTALADRVAGDRVVLARSDRGSGVLPEGLRDAGATVEETVLYELVRPAEAGESVAMAADGALDGALFTASMTVQNFVAIARDRDVLDAVREGLADAVVGAIGEPTARAAREAGLSVDVVPSEADADALADAVCDRLRE
ncbi:uroporphyrinogen-III synthase [Halococcoides cellulosivorans]|uniref:Uroporphyrinogen-III synthase n=1 Tax=Halococcoides cellulosivorans TaxID=1679096 RepID=A0A2R4WYJ0_9EURY|nr:uroporphyrinogen-III synthase [Halococcoides cellulosivorans]AWB26617.1 uroporphyrinogen-III synthase [Halococcoides cellulosivorans]